MIVREGALTGSNLWIKPKVSEKGGLRDHGERRNQNVR